LFSLVATGNDIFTTTSSSIALNTTQTSSNPTDQTVTATVSFNNLTSTYFPVKQQILSKSIQAPGMV